MNIFNDIWANAYENNAISVVTKVIHTFKLKVSKLTIKKTLEEHPDFPSLLSVSDALTSWGVQNLSLRTKIEDLKQLPLPWLVEVRNFGNSKISIVKSFTDQELTISDDNKQTWNKMGWYEFSERWSGVTMILEPDTEAGEKEYIKKQTEYLTSKLVPILLFSLIFILCILRAFDIINVLINDAWGPVIFLMLKLIGIFITLILLRYELSGDDSYLQKVCKTTKRTNCQAVLRSSASNLLGILSWSEVGFAYFTGGLITLLIAGENYIFLNVLAWMNLLAVPYIFFSIFYQWKIAKQWCKLCLAVQLILFVELMVSIITIPLNINKLSAYPIMIVFIISLIPVVIWLFLKPVLISTIENRKFKLEFLRLKNNSQIFDSMLSRGRTFNSSPIGLGITLGNSNGRIKLVKVCNPFCGPCAKAHPDIDELIKNNKEIEVQIIFTASNLITDKKSQTVRHLMAIAEMKDELMTKAALDNWYNASQKDYDIFSNKYPLNKELLDQQDRKLQSMSEWCKTNEIQHTPTFFLQGHELPKMYRIKDLPALLVDPNIDEA